MLVVILPIVVVLFLNAYSSLAYAFVCGILVACIVIGYDGYVSTSSNHDAVVKKTIRILKSNKTLNILSGKEQFLIKKSLINKNIIITLTNKYDETFQYVVKKKDLNYEELNKHLA